MMRGGGINPVAANVQYKSTEYTSDNQKKVFITGNSKLLWFGERLIPCNSSWSSRRRRWWWRIGPCWSVFSNCARFYCHLAAVSWPVQWCYNHGISTSLRLRMMMLVFRLKRVFSVRRHEAASRGGSRSSAIMSIVLDLSQRDETWSCSFSLESSLQQKYLTTS